MTVDNPPADSATRIGAPPEHGADVALDRLNLEQALRDVDVANRRVIDLTHRLTGMQRELLEARAELARTRPQFGRARREVARLARSRALAPLRRLYRAAQRSLR
jgi:hypothetical protein